jgi:hypothetical protein
MRYLKRFNESKDIKSYIKDILMYLEDDGINIDIKNDFTPGESFNTPYYRITFTNLGENKIFFNLKKHLDEIYHLISYLYDVKYCLKKILYLDTNGTASGIVEPKYVENGDYVNYFKNVLDGDSTKRLELTFFGQNQK